MFGRYRCIELIDTDTGNDIRFVLPKKIVFKIGHVYTCYFDNQNKVNAADSDKPSDGAFNPEIDLPTNGFLGFEDFGVYQEKSVTVTAAVSEKPSSNEANVSV